VGRPRCNSGCACTATVTKLASECLNRRTLSYEETSANVQALISSTLLRTQSDARLVALTREGNERAFEMIVERYRRPLHGYCRRVLSDSRAEDAVQQTFLNAWTSLRDGAEIRDLRPWLYRIAHNTALNAAKRAGYDYDELRESLASPYEGHDDELERRRIMRETLAGLAALPERQREALLQTVIAGHSQEAVAVALGVTDGAVRQLVHRARTTLRAAATAVTPLPLVAWLASAESASALTAQRVGEIALGGGAAGIASVLAKGGTAVVVAGAIAVGPGGGVDTLRNAREPDAPARTSQTSSVDAASQAAPAPTSGQQSGGGSDDADTRRSGSDERGSEDDDSAEREDGDESKGGPSSGSLSGDDDDFGDTHGGAKRDGDPAGDGDPDGAGDDDEAPGHDGSTTKTKKTKKSGPGNKDPETKSSSGKEPESDTDGLEPDKAAEGADTDDVDSDGDGGGSSGSSGHGGPGSR